MTVTFEQFQADVEAWFPNAGEHGEFKDYSPEFVNDKHNPGRIYYTWQHFDGFHCAAFDSNDPIEAQWLVENGRGAIGRGATLAEADANEKKNYDAGSVKFTAI